MSWFSRSQGFTNVKYVQMVPLIPIWRSVLWLLQLKEDILSGDEAIMMGGEELN